MQQPDSRPTHGLAAEAPTVILRMASVRRMTTLGRSTIYRLMSQKLFPSAIKLGPRAVGWRLTDIDQWLEDRPDSSH